MLKSVKLIFLTVAMLAMTVVTVTAGTYVSLNGNFVLTYPENWQQVDYKLVDLYLARNQVERSMFAYEAALAASDSDPIFSGPYVMLYLDKRGNLSNFQVDSSLKEIGSVAELGVKTAPVADFFKAREGRTLFFDRGARTAVIQHDLVLENDVVEKNLILMKYYDQGILSFYFYAPESVFEASLKTFQEIFNSFTTENVREALPKEQLTLAKLPTEESADTSGSSMARTGFLSGAGFIILIALLIVIRKQRKKS